MDQPVSALGTGCWKFGSIHRFYPQSFERLFGAWKPVAQRVEACPVGWFAHLARLADPAQAKGLIRQQRHSHHASPFCIFPRIGSLSCLQARSLRAQASRFARQLILRDNQAASNLTLVTFGRHISPSSCVALGILLGIGSLHGVNEFSLPICKVLHILKVAGDFHSWYRWESPRR